MNAFWKILLYFVIGIPLTGFFDTIAHLPDYNTFLWGTWNGMILVWLYYAIDPFSELKDKEKDNG